MNITRLGIKNFLAIRDQEISPDNKLNVFAGKNGNGKTSILKAIEIGLKGSSDKDLIHHGTDKAEILIDLGHVTIQRTLKSKGMNTLKVTAPVTLPGGESKNMPIPGPQEYIDNLLSPFSFDPFRFIALEGKEKSKYLREILKTKITPEMLDFLDADVTSRIDYSKDGLDICSELYQAAYQYRTTINKEVSKLKTLAETASETVQGFDAATYVDREPELIQKRQDAQKRLTEAETIKKQAEGTMAYVKKIETTIEADTAELNAIDQAAISSIPVLQTAIKGIQEEMAALTKMLNELGSSLVKAQHSAGMKERLEKDITGNTATLKALPSVNDIPDIEAIGKEIDEINLALSENLTQGEKFKIHNESLELQRKYAAEKEKADGLTEALKKLKDEIPALITKEANIPIEGLRIEGDKIHIGDKTLDNMSTSEQINIAVQIVEAFNRDKPLKVICVDRCESLDDETLKQFVDAIPDSYQFFTTIVTHEGQVLPEGSYMVEQGIITKQEVA